MKSVLALLLILTAASAYGQSNCDAAVVDDAGVFGTDATKVLAATQALVNQGFDVRVRTVKDMGTPTLDQLERSYERACASWQAPEGGRKNNLVVLMVAVRNRKTGLYYGSQWKSELDQDWPQIQSEEINPRFRDHDFAGGFVAGLNGIGESMERHNKLASAPGSTIILPPSEPTDLSGFWTFLYWLLAIASVIGVVILVIWLVNRRNSGKSAQQRALIAQQRVVGLINELTADLPISAALLGRERYTRDKQLLDQASEAYSQLKQSSLADPSTPGLAEGQYVTIAMEYEAILGHLTEAKFSLDNPDEEQPQGIDSHEAHGSPRVKAHRRREPEPATVAEQERPREDSFSHNTIVAPVVISETESPRREREDDTSSSSSSSSWPSSSDSGGGSSDFGSSDSGGGGSSDFGGGGGDSGGGSSSW